MWSRGRALLFFDHSTRRGWWVSVMPRPLFTPGKTRYPLYRRLGGPQCRSGVVRIFSHPPGFDPRTFQPVASRYTDWATLPRISYIFAQKQKEIFSIWKSTSITKDEIRGEWIKLRNDQLSDPYFLPNIVRVLKSWRMRCAEHIARMGERRGVYMFLIENLR